MAMRSICLIPLAFVLACTESPTDVVARYAVLDDVGESNWTEVTVGRDHTCATKTGGVAYCWGSNQFGQLGTQRSDTLCGPKANTYACILSPTRVETTLRFRSLSAGSMHTCGITDAGEAYCWGANTSNQLGDLSRGGPTPVRIPTTLSW